MKNLIVLTGLIIGLVSVSCTGPKVASQINRSYPPLAANKEVAILKTNEIPIGSENLGMVRVYDSGTSIKCDSVAVMNLILQEARKTGANAVTITEHSRPSFWGSSCHQMTAQLMNVIDFNTPAVTSIDKAPVTAQPQMYAYERKEKVRLLPRMSFGLNGGYAWRTAKLSDKLSSDERRIAKGVMSGTTFDASANYYFNDTYGIGMFYSRYNAQHSEPVYVLGDNESDRISANLEVKDNITFLGPLFLIRAGANKWIFNCNLGIGYLGYKSNTTLSFKNAYTRTTGGNAGMLADINMQYKLSDSFGIALGASAISGVLTQLSIDENGKKRVEKLNKDEYEGLGHLRLVAGIRYYLK